MTKTTQLVDTYMDLSEKIAELKKAQDGIKQNLTASGAGQYDGTYGYVTVADAERSTVNWKGIATKLGASNQMIAGNTKTTEYVKVTGYMFNKKAKVA